MRRHYGICCCWAVLAACVLAPGTFAQEARNEASWTPNGIVQVSERFAALIGEKAIDRTSPLRDTILKTEIYGFSHSTGKITVDFIPCENAAVIDLVMTADSISQTIGYRGPVQAHTLGHTTIYGRKRIWVTASGIWFAPAWSWNWPVKINQYLTSRFQNPRLDQFARNLGSRRAKKQEDEFRSILRWHIEQRTNCKFNSDSDPGLIEANRSYQETLSRLAGGRELMPDRLALKTTDTALFLLARMSDDEAQPSRSPPAISEPSDLSLRLHQSWLEAAANRMFAGKTETAESMREEFVKQFGPMKRPPTKAPDDDRQNLAITFAKKRPAQFLFTDDTATMIVHATEFNFSNRAFEGMDITATYKLEKTEMGMRMTRLGELKIYPPGYKVGDRLTASQRATRAVLERLLGDVFQEVMELDEIPIPSILRKIGKLLPSQVRTSDGWLVLGVRRPD